MNTKRVLALVLALMMTLTLFGCGEKPAEDGTDDAPKTVTITDMIGRQVEIVPGSYQRVVCIGAGALRLYSYVGDVSLLCGVEDIDNTTLEERPKMFDGVARPYVMVYGDTFAALPSCGVGGPNAQAAEAEKILSCTPDIIVSEYEDTDKAEALQQQVGVPVITLRSGPDGVFSEDFSGSITLLGQVFGKETRASELLAFVSAETADIQARTAGIAEDSKPAVYICGLGNWGTTNHLMTIESYSTFTVANIKNTVSGLSAKGVQPIGKPIVSGANLKKSSISDSGRESKMKFELGDRVRILASGQTGSICDDLIRDGQQLYIVDCAGECDSEEMIDCVRVVAEHEIEAI